MSGSLLDRDALRHAFDLLLDHLGLRDVAEVEAVVGCYFPDESLSDRSRALIEDLVAERAEEP